MSSFRGKYDCPAFFDDAFSALARSASKGVSQWKPRTGVPCLRCGLVFCGNSRACGTATSKPFAHQPHNVGVALFKQYHKPLAGGNDSGPAIQPRTPYSTEPNVIQFAKCFPFLLLALSSGPALAIEKPAPQPVGGKIKWVYDYEQGKRLSRQTGRPMFVVFRCER